jgi:hypothetical protein
MLYLGRKNDSNKVLFLKLFIAYLKFSIFCFDLIFAGRILTAHKKSLKKNSKDKLEITKIGNLV